MKFPGWNWMHRKSQQNMDEQLKTHAFGEPVVEEGYYPKRSYCLTPARHFQKESLLRKSFAGFDTVRVEQVLEEDSPAEIFDLFHGLFAIGTLGSEKVIIEPATPTFGVSDDYMAEQETDVAQNDLEIIGNESEKVARAEGQKDRNGKPAMCDSLKMNNIDEAKQVIGTDTNQNVMDSPIHSLKTTEAKKNRTSLYELMQCDMEEDATRKHETKENMETIKKDTTVKQFVNILKQRVLSATLSKGSNDTSTTNFVSSKKKLHKILRIFDKKVHPENSRVIRKSKTFDKYETESKIPCYGGYHNKYQILPVRDGDIMTLPHKVIVNEHVWHYKNNLDLPSFAPRGSISNKKKGCWIKTDAEYLGRAYDNWTAVKDLVLEL